MVSERLRYLAVAPATLDAFHALVQDEWLTYERAGETLVGFCGFVEFPALHDAPELVYALLERYAGRGYATEMARASIEHARTRGGLHGIVTSVDPGAFGRTLLLRLAAPRAEVRRRRATFRSPAR